MFRILPHRFSTALTAAACAALITGLAAGVASADPKHGRGPKKFRGHRHNDHCGHVVRVERSVPVWRAHDHAPRWCADEAHIVHAGRPYWYNVGLGAYFGGVNVNLQLGNYAPDGYGYWDPYCHTYFDSVHSYTSHCKRHTHRPALEVVRLDAGFGWDGGYGWVGYQDAHSCSICRR